MYFRLWHEWEIRLQWKRLSCDEDQLDWAVVGNAEKWMSCQLRCVVERVVGLGVGEWHSVSMEELGEHSAVSSWMLQGWVPVEEALTVAILAVVAYKADRLAGEAEPVGVAEPAERIQSMVGV